jgi:hypothetical protein
MPEISRFYGIVIKMFRNDHQPPSFRAKYGRGRMLFAIALVSMVVMLVSIAAWLAIDWSDPFNDETFSVTKWAHRASSESGARMARDLIRNHLPSGLSRSKVTALLSPPDKVLTGEDAGGHRLPVHETYAYHIGSWSAYGFDDAFVYVHFDSSGTVLSAEITGY